MSLRLVEGWVEDELALEFPGLRIAELTAPVPPSRTPPGVRERLRVLADRYHGARAVALRSEPIPAAYRAFYRHVGLDPEVQRPAAEEAAADRLMRGGFGSGAALPDAQLLAVVETGVPVWALDDRGLEGVLGLRQARTGERLGEGPLASDLPGGRVVVADTRVPVAVLFGAVAAGHEPGKSALRLRLFTVGAPGVPRIHVEEALWTCAEALEGDLARG